MPKPATVAEKPDGDVVAAEAASGRKSDLVRPVAIDRAFAEVAFAVNHIARSCTNGHSFRRDDIDMSVFCFAERAHAEQFRDRFGGEFIDPASRPKWPSSRRR